MKEQEHGEEATSLTADVGTHWTAHGCGVPRKPTSTHNNTPTSPTQRGDPELLAGVHLDSHHIPGSPQGQAVKHIKSKPHNTANKQTKPNDDSLGTRTQRRSVAGPADPVQATGTCQGNLRPGTPGSEGVGVTPRGSRSAQGAAATRVQHPRS